MQTFAWKQLAGGSSAGKLALVVVAGLALAGCSGEKEGPIVDPALSTLVPADTTLLAGIRVEDLQKTPIYQKYLAERPLPIVDEFASEFEIDPRKDLWELLLISNGKESAVLGRGRFSNEAEPRVARERQGFKRTNYGGFTMVGDDSTAVLMMGPTIMGVGDIGALKSIVDTRDKTNGPPTALTDLMKEIPRGPAIWSVTSGTPVNVPEDAPANIRNFARIMQSIQSGLMYLDLRNGISAKATGITAGDAQAKELYDAFHGMMGMAQFMGGSDAERFQRVADGIRITQDGARVNVYVEQQEDTVAMLADMIQGIGQGRGGRGGPGQGKGRGQEDAPMPLE